jgi:hypothetical protein
MSKVTTLKVNYSINNSEFGSLSIDPESTIEILISKVLHKKNLPNENYIITYNNTKVGHSEIIKNIIGKDTTPLFVFKTETTEKGKF